MEQYPTPSKEKSSRDTLNYGILDISLYDTPNKVENRDKAVIVFAKQIHSGRLSYVYIDKVHVNKKPHDVSD